MCEALLEFPEGWGSGVLQKLPSVGEVWILRCLAQEHNVVTLAKTLEKGTAIWSPACQPLSYHDYHG